MTSDSLCLHMTALGPSMQPRIARGFRALLGSAFVVLALLAGPIAAQASGKPRVAIGTPMLGEDVDGSSAAKRHLDLGLLTTDLEAAIRATRKFDVVSRQKEVLQAVRDEQKLAESDAFAGDAAESGALANANYKILPTVQQFAFYRHAKAVPNLDGKYKITDQGRILLTAQLLDTTTGQIMSTFDMESSFQSKTRLANGKGGSPGSSNFANLSAAVSAQMADQLVDNVFPMKVIKAAGKQVWINRGRDGGLKPGQELLLFEAGEELIDPDTGESLGSAESEIGTVKVTRVNAKFTIGEIQTIDPYVEVEKGFILRER